MLVNLSMNKTLKHIMIYLLLTFIFPSIVFSKDEANETSIANDIYTALTLQGINCDGIDELQPSEKGSYDVACNSGGQFNISQTTDGILTIVDKVTGAVLKSIGMILKAIPLTGYLFQHKDNITEHDIEVARSLFSIIELSGYACDSITKVSSTSSDDHIVTCMNDKNYHIYTGEDGSVEVDALGEIENQTKPK